MSYSQTLQYLYAKLPMFSRIGDAAIKKDLYNTIALCSALGNPQQKFRTIHVAGTNGKGSVSHMLAAVLQTAGFKTGLYTSPHLRDFRERIKVDGEMISEELVIEFVNSQKQLIEEVQPSFFEVTVAMAFDHFAKQKVDIAVIEVGLGGRLDSTNIITPVLSVITNIGYDHMNILGNTLPEIAFEKAGIIKPGIPAIISERQPEVEQVFLKKAKEVQAPLAFASDEWQEVETGPSQEGRRPLVLQSAQDKDDRINLSLDLTGSYQVKNVKAVLSAIGQLKRSGFRISDTRVSEGLSRIKELTGLMGRWQTLSVAPLVICDTGHNEDGIKEVLKNIEATEFDKLHMVIGMVKDKEIGKVLSLLPKKASYYFCQPQIERAKPAGELAEEAQVQGLQGEVFASVVDALAAAKKNAYKDDLIFVGGSTFVVAEVV
ncbi:folylpolyglutamate synthase/dihydrofolate synthase family protein [Pedobacter sp. SYSU D00535]|uniref:bifunctional folylpolyglutamate synthase/dihydrofolate synthase n=1 Tax=Pedobacter sp. SYSU D00535 TaxID=2810308 RepID=UPI001F602325|nr:folylpolyglutamate synthase/dihydrofolate synthase family protein [Pedobacter sp. SYSU D00535]